MTSASLFDRIAEALERGSSLSRLEARGALRLTVQHLGLDPKELPPHELGALLEVALPKDLEERGVRDARSLCSRILYELRAAAAAGPLPAPFDWAAHALEEQTAFSRLEARGILRRILKDAGLAPERVTRAELGIVFTALAVKHLEACAVRDPEGVRTRVLSQLQDAALSEPAGADSPEEIFDRLGRR